MSAALLRTLPAGALRPGDRVVLDVNTCNVWTVQAVERRGAEVGVVFAAFTRVWRVTDAITVVN